MENLISTPDVSAPPRARPYFLLGTLVLALGVVAFVVQFFILKRLAVPWYLPVLGTVGVALMVLSVARRPRILRILGLVVFVLLTGAEWFLILASKLPAYQGPAKIGAPIPAFAATLAKDGSTFTDQDLKKETITVLLFFRGHW